MKKSAIIGLFVISLSLTGCYKTRDVTWHCYDEKGKPVEGVLIVCNYGLANYGKRAVNHRFSDAQGKVVLDFDEDTPRELMRGYDCIYSAKLRSGSVDIGERWHRGAPIPESAVYFDEYNYNIYIKSGDNNPVFWHSALNSLIDEYRNHNVRKAGSDAPGVAKIDIMFSILVPRERALFLAKYGDQLVPSVYIKTGSVGSYFPDIFQRDTSRLKFKDVTLPLP
jgi:hypothetical protein